MIHIFCPKKSKGVRALVRMLKEIGAQTSLIRKDNLLIGGNNIVNWGYRNSLNVGLNRNVVGNKLTELKMLKDAQVPSVNFDINQPGGWLARKLKHRAGNDLIQDLTTGDFYVEKVDNISEEFRIHIFKEKSIRSGIKRKKSENAHPWIRSLERGWWLDYGTYCQERINNKLRNVAKAAIKALEYDFGAVDVGLLTNGNVVVFEVNSAPGLTTKNTAMSYARHIKEAFNVNS